MAPTTATTTTPQAPAALGPVKTRRRPVLIIASVAALLLSALGGVWLWTAATSSVEVVVAKAAVPRGAQGRPVTGAGLQDLGGQRRQNRRNHGDRVRGGGNRPESFGVG